MPEMTRLQFIRSAILAALAEITGALTIRSRKTHVQLVADFVKEWADGHFYGASKAKMISQDYPGGWRGVGAQHTACMRRAGFGETIVRSSVLIRDDWSERKKRKVVEIWIDQVRRGEHLVYGEDMLRGHESNRLQAEALGLEPEPRPWNESWV